MDVGTAIAVPQELQAVLRLGKIQRAPASPLLTDGKLPVDLIDANWRGNHLTLFVQRQSDATDKLLGVVSRSLDSGAIGTAYDWHPVAGSSCQASAVDLAALEHMFRVAINDVVTDPYRFGVVDGRPDDLSFSLTHAQLLERIAKARECVADALTSTGARPPKRWRTVLLEPAEPAKDGTIVSARLRSAGGPMVSATILFTRAPHLECSATTDSNGIAGCKLEDTHGHDDHGDEVSGAPTLASFPGDAKPDFIALPTTIVLRR